MTCLTIKLANLNKIIIVSIDWGGGWWRNEHTDIPGSTESMDLEGSLTAGINTHWLFTYSLPRLHLEEFILRK